MNKEDFTVREQNQIDKLEKDIRSLILLDCSDEKIVELYREQYGMNTIKIKIYKCKVDLGRK